MSIEHLYKEMETEGMNEWIDEVKKYVYKVKNGVVDTLTEFKGEYSDYLVSYINRGDVYLTIIFRTVTYEIYSILMVRKKNEGVEALYHYEKDGDIGELFLWGFRGVDEGDKTHVCTVLTGVIDRVILYVIKADNRNFLTMWLELIREDLLQHIEVFRKQGYTSRLGITYKIKKLPNKVIDNLLNATKDSRLTITVDGVEQDGVVIQIGKAEFQVIFYDGVTGVKEVKLNKRETLFSKERHIGTSKAELRERR